MNITRFKQEISRLPDDAKFGNFCDAVWRVLGHIFDSTHEYLNGQITKKVKRRWAQRTLRFLLMFSELLCLIPFLPFIFIPIIWEEIGHQEIKDE